jgi:hypothetical protein
VKLAHILFVILLGYCPLVAMSGQDTLRLDSAQAKELINANEQAKKWIERQTTPGLRLDSNQMVFDEEVKRIVNDSVYRDSVYRQPYTFKDVAGSLSKGNLRLAFYQMINLYPTDKERVIKYTTAYDQAVEADKIVKSAYYTYALLDPRITKIEQGRPNIFRPDIMEELFQYANEISANILERRKQSNKQRAAPPPKQ